jgi:hypothetical protein
MEVPNVKIPLWYVKIKKQGKTYYLFLFDDDEEDVVLHTTERKLVIANNISLEKLRDLILLAAPPFRLKKNCVLRIKEEKVMELILHKGYDGQARIVNCLNTYFDCLKASNTSLPSDIEQRLYAFADHMTFDREFGQTFLQANAISARQLQRDVAFLFEQVWQNAVEVDSESLICRFLIDYYNKQ